MTAKKQTSPKKAPAASTSGIVPKKNPTRTFEKNVDNNGFHVVKKAHLSPFVVWEDEPVIEGIVSSFRTVKGGKFGDQDVVDVGDYSVGLTASLVSLPDHDGEYVRVIYEGDEPTKKGNVVKTFTILVRDAPKA